MDYFFFLVKRLNNAVIGPIILTVTKIKNSMDFTNESGNVRRGTTERTLHRVLTKLDTG